jgi:hypothetical protein
MGVIDTLSAGYATVNRHPWIIAVPVLLDLFFWFGHHLSLAPLVQKTLDSMQETVGQSADLLQSYPDYWESVARIGEQYNLLSLLAIHFPGLPSLMSMREGLGPKVALSDPVMVSVLFLLLPVLGIGLASIYYASISSQVRGSSEEPSQLWGRIWRNWGRFLGFLLLAIGIGMLFGLPVMVLVTIAAAINMAFANIVISIFWVAALWLGFYLFFVVAAIAVSDVGPIKAIRNSVAVITYNLGSALGLVALTWVIQLGMPIVWDAVAQNEVGTVVGILGNAYIATGLAAAGMIYYRDRIEAIAAGIQQGQRP